MLLTPVRYGLEFFLYLNIEYAPLFTDKNVSDKNVSKVFLAIQAASRKIIRY